MIIITPITTAGTGGLSAGQHHHHQQIWWSSPESEYTELGLTGTVTGIEKPCCKPPPPCNHQSYIFSPCNHYYRTCFHPVIIIMIVDIIIIRLSYGGHFYHYHWCCHYNNWHCYHYQSLIVTTSLIKQQFCSDSLNIFTKRYFYKTELKYSRSPSSANITLRRGVIWDLAQSARKFF